MSLPEPAVSWVFVRTRSTVFQNCARSGCAGLSCISGLHAACPSSSIPSIVRAWLSVPVWSALLRPSERAIRLRLDSPEPGVAVVEGCDLKAEEPGRSGRRFRHMCQIMGRLVQRMPPRGSKAEYAPRGTYDHVKSG